MPLKPTGKTDDVFVGELKKKLDANADKQAKAILAAVQEKLSAQLNKMMSPNPEGGRNFEPPVTAAKDSEKLNETKLEEQRKQQDQEPPVAIQENQLNNEPVANRKDEPKDEITEGQLEKHELKHAPNKDLQGTIEQRLNEASKSLFPHRNPKAHERTGDRRPINALPEELGRNSDEAKNERYDKANKPGGQKRIVDEDVGSQLTNEKTTIAFNARRNKFAALTKDVPAYLEYKDALASAAVGDFKFAAMATFAELRDVDGTMMSIIDTASSEKRGLTQDEMAQISALKSRKTELLKKKQH